VQVISPNNAELAGFFGIEDTLVIDDPQTIQNLAAELVAVGIGPSGDGAVVVRAGKMGCLVVSPKHSPTWLPAYHQPQGRGENNAKVIDPTGGGNAFIGGLSVGLARHGMTDYIFAAAMGIVAASFAIEQIGIPVLVKVEGSEDEFWNGFSVSARFEEYQKRVEGMGILLGRG
jgi:sugar/nucleoside kinase (ribokinase family)